MVLVALLPLLLALLPQAGADTGVDLLSLADAEFRTSPGGGTHEAATSAGSGGQRAAAAPRACPAVAAVHATALAQLAAEARAAPSHLRVYRAVHVLLLGLALARPLLDHLSPRVLLLSHEGCHAQACPGP